MRTSLYVIPARWLAIVLTRISPAGPQADHSQGYTQSRAGDASNAEQKGPRQAADAHQGMTPLHNVLVVTY